MYVQEAAISVDECDRREKKNHIPAHVCCRRKCISNKDITINERNGIESVVAPGVLHIKAYKSINFPLHPIVFA